MWHRPSKVWAPGLCLAVAAGGAPLVHAEEKQASANDVVVDKSAEGLHFKVPPDWPIEKRGGVVAPIPIEEYLGKKFKGIEAQLQALEQRMNGLDVRVRVSEERAKQPPTGEGLRSTKPQTSP